MGTRTVASSWPQSYGAVDKTYSSARSNLAFTCCARLEAAIVNILIVISPVSSNTNIPNKFKLNAFRVKESSIWINIFKVFP